MPSSLRRIGSWCGGVLIFLGFAYLGLILILLFSGSGFPPVEPYQTIVNGIVLFTAVGLVFFWAILHQALPTGKKLFSRISLAFVIIFAALTSINRYVALTVVRQSLAAGHLDGLQWFLPYGWPSVMLAIEYLAWGFFLGLAFLSLAPVFNRGRLERAIFWTSISVGVLCLIAVVGQMIGSSSVNFSPFTLMGVIGWGPGLTVWVVLLTSWLRKQEVPA